MLERREDGRVSLEIHFSFEIVFPEVSSNKVRRNAITNNISTSGLVFRIDEDIPIGTKIRIFLNLPGSPDLVELIGEVIRVEKLLSTHDYDVGVTFIDLPFDVKEEFKSRFERMDITKVLKKAAEAKGSDLHLTSNSPPMVRAHGKLIPLESDNEVISAEEIKQMAYSIMSDAQKEKFEQQKDIDFVFSLGTDLRYRVSVYQQRGNVEMVLRIIPSKIKDRTQLGLPLVVEELCKLKDGIILVGGTTGSGKTTTISMMIDLINRTSGGVILSLEKPIEYIHKNINGIVKQREVGFDVPSFAAGLLAGLRQDPDVIVVGEIIEADTIETALNAAETGHLVISSIHAADTLQVLDRIISNFPLEQQVFIASRLSHCLRAIIVQSLLPHKNGYDRVLATEVCIANYAVKRTIRERNFNQLNSTIQSNAQKGMHLLQSSIDEIYEQGLISGETYEVFTRKK